MWVKRCKIAFYCFVLKEFAIYWIYRFANIILAPFYFHFGHHWLFIDIMVFLTDSVDTVGLFFIMFVFILTTTIVRNKTFQSYLRSFYKNYLNFFNVLPLFSYFSTFFKSYLKTITFFINKTYFFFKKK